MKKLMMAIAVGAHCLVFAQFNSSPNSASSLYSTPSNDPLGQGVQVPQSSNLSEEEQQFISGLSPLHQKVFSQQFSVSQRVEAMTLSKAQVQGIEGQESSISPDEAVEIVMKNARTNSASSSGVDEHNNSTPYSGAFPSTSTN